MRLIDADVLFSSFRDDPEINGKNLARARKHIREAPTVDAVDVVRCKDCEMFCPCENGNHICVRWGSWTDLEGWCYKGEKKSDDD